VIAQQLTLTANDAPHRTEPQSGTVPPTATWDWTPKRDHTKRTYRRTHCRECRGDVWALITPGLWLVCPAGHVWKVER